MALVSALFAYQILPPRVINCDCLEPTSSGCPADAFQEFQVASIGSIVGLFCHNAIGLKSACSMLR
jgi:hypothetical protein